MKVRWLYFLVIVLLGLAGSGCLARQGPQVRLAAGAAGGDICRLAVLPFTSEADRTAEAIQVYRIFTGELIAAGNYRVEPEGEIHFFLNRQRLRAGDLLNSRHYRELAEDLEVDALVRGRVITLESKKSADGEVPHCALQVDLLAAESGELLASTYHRRSGADFQKVLHFGTLRTTSELVAQVAREVITAWQEKGLKHCSEE